MGTQPTHLDESQEPKKMTAKHLMAVAENCKSIALQRALMLAAGKPVRCNGDLLTFFELDKQIEQHEEASNLIRDIKAMQSPASYNRMMRSVQEYRAKAASLPVSSIPYPDTVQDKTVYDLIVALQQCSPDIRAAFKRALES